MWKDILMRLRALFFRSRMDGELQEELDFHIEMEARKSGQRNARLKFGSVASATEECRDERGISSIEILAKDLRFAVRMFVGFDRQGGNNDAQQVPMVKALIDAGFADHLMFSSDASSGYAKTVTIFLPKLKTAGVSDDVLHHIMVDNPRRFLAFVPKRPRKK